MLTDSMAIDRVASGKLARGSLAHGGMRDACCADCAGLGDASSTGGTNSRPASWIAPTIALAGLAGAVWLAWPKKKRRSPRYHASERRTAQLPAETMSQVVWERR